MADKDGYITALKEAIYNMHGCHATHIRTTHVHETFQGKTVWDGDVEVFTVDHFKARRAYAWAHLEGERDDQTRFWAVLELPPVKDAKTAVQASIMADSKRPQS
jgi:hypothetical protein